MAHHIPNRVKELDGDGIVVPGEFGAADYLIQFASMAPGWISTLRICRLGWFQHSSLGQPLDRDLCASNLQSLWLCQGDVPVAVGKGWDGCHWTTGILTVPVLGAFYLGAW